MQLTVRGALAGALVLCPAALVMAQQPNTGQPQPRQFQQAAPARQIPQQQRDVVATVNGDAITRTELEVRLQSQLQGRQVAPDKANQLRNQTLKTLIESRLVEQHIIEKGPKVEPKEVEAVIGQAQEQLAAQNVDFEQYLASRGHTTKSFQKRVQGSLGWQKFQQQQLQEQSLQDFYEKNRDQFQAASFEQARDQVAQSYVAAIWDGIVREVKPDAEIKLVNANAAQPGPEAPRPAPSGSLPQ